MYEFGLHGVSTDEVICPLRFISQPVEMSKVQFAAVLVFHDSRNWGQDIQYICDVLRSPTGTIGTLGDDTHEQPFLAFSHGDLLWSNGFPTPRFGQGAFQAAVRAVYEETSGRPLVATTFGKPQRLTYEYAHGLLAQHAGALEDTSPIEDLNVWMIGDNPASDIHGANQYGWKSALVSRPEHRNTTSLSFHSARGIQPFLSTYRYAPASTVTSMDRQRTSPRFLLTMSKSPFVRRSSKSGVQTTSECALWNDQ